jgi:hypothetical protein
MMMSEKEDEQILRDMHKLIDAYAKAKQASVVRPIPIVKDRQGRLVKDLTLKEWLAKLDEEVTELKAELLGSYVLEDKLMNGNLDHSRRWNIGSEMADIVELLHNMGNQMQMDNVFWDGLTFETNEKMRGRGLID